MEKKLKVIEPQTESIMFLSFSQRIFPILLWMALGLLISFAIGTIEAWFLKPMIKDGFLIRTNVTPIFLYFIPGYLAYKKAYLIIKLGAKLYFFIFTATMGMVMGWVILRFDFMTILLAITLALMIFMAFAQLGLKAKRPIFKGIDNFLFMSLVVIISLIEGIISLYLEIPSQMIFTYLAIAFVCGMGNANLFQRMKYGIHLGINKSEITEKNIVVALEAYINFIGMIVLIDVFKYIIKILLVNSGKKNIFSKQTKDAP